MRGGTSKAVMFRAADLPAERELWAPIFLGVIGSPDPNGRQLDGMGGGISSLSKICVIGPSTRAGAELLPSIGMVLEELAKLGMLFTETAVVNQVRIARQVFFQLLVPVQEPVESFTAPGFRHRFRRDSYREQEQREDADSSELLHL